MEAATVGTDSSDDRVARFRQPDVLLLAGGHRVAFDSDRDRVLHSAMRRADGS